MKNKLKLNFHPIKAGFLSGFASYAGLFLFFVLIVSCSKSDKYVTPDVQGVQIKTNSTFGKIITDSNGKSLYFFSNDMGVSSTCTGGCLTKWSIFHVDNIAIGTGLDQADFAEITNADGTKQTTYKGWPLYYFQQDVNEDDVKGDKVGDVWYIAKPDYSVMVGNFKSVKFLVAPKGKTLYTFSNDPAGTSACTSATCTTNWPPYLNTAGSVPSLLSAGSLTVFNRGDGQQSAYKGKALYYHIDDHVRGDSTGQGLANGAWLKLGQGRF